jgi:hypothetical protein
MIMTTKLTAKDRKIVTTAAVMAVLVLAVLAWGQYTNARKAAEPKPIAVDLAETMAKAAKAPADPAKK